MVVAAAVEGLRWQRRPRRGDRKLLHVASSPSGAWSGHAQQLAAYTSGGWRFTAARDGLNAYVRSSGSTAVYHDGAWEIGTLKGSQVTVAGQKVLGSRSAQITAPTGGATVDAEARAAIGQILTAMRTHGLSKYKKPGEPMISERIGK